MALNRTEVFGGNARKHQLTGRLPVNPCCIADPELVAAILEQGVDPVFGSANLAWIWLYLNGRKCFGTNGLPVNAVIRTHPEHSRTVVVNGGCIAAGESLQQVDVGLVSNDFIAGRVDSIQSIGSTYPDDSG